MQESQMMMITAVKQDCPKKLAQKFNEIGIFAGQIMQILSIYKKQILFRINNVEYIIRKNYFDFLEVTQYEPVTS